MSTFDLMAEEQCAACGKGDDGLKTCNGCKAVKYCDVSCQKLSEGTSQTTHEAM